MTIENQVYVRRLLDVLGRAGQSIVLRHHDQGISGDVLRNLIFQYARALRRLDMGRGALLGMFAPNRPEALALRYAAHVLGVATVNLSNPGNASRRQALVRKIAPDLLVLFADASGCLDQWAGFPIGTIGFDQVGSRGRLDVLASTESMDAIRYWPMRTNSP
jgi:fatty-acyl-CoA synthase